MNSSVGRYKVVLIGFIVTVILGVILTSLGIIIINKDDSKLEFLVLFIIWWIAISFGLHSVTFIKKHKHTFLKILGLISLLIGAMIVDDYMNWPNNPITLILILLFFVGVISIVYQQWKWFKNLQSEKTKAELALLKNQINPHFFFNTLNNLYTLTLNNSEAAPKVILKLSDVMRYTIYQGRKDKVSLEDEVKYLNNYIALHDIRYKKTVQINFSHDIKKDISIAPLLLIVLLENAFKHGVESMRDNAYIKMELYSSDQSIQFDIENNFDDALQSKKDTGLGLGNLVRRLELIYPDKHNFFINKNGSVFNASLKIDTK